ncbi:MAG: amidohydrolase family protein, partial [Acidimicrobiales bacterium]
GSGVLGPDERVTRRAAVELFLGTADAPGVPRRVEVGGAGDLCLLKLAWADIEELGADLVALCIIDGRVVADLR